ncbi:MAG: glycosyltransferase family 9 protein [Woeseia sp.]
MKRVLLIAVPGIGDAFLATPLLRSLKQANPDVCIDVLVREGKSILEHNPDVSRILVQGRRPGFFDSLRFLAGIFRRYDLAVSTSTTDRSYAILLCAASRRFGKVANAGFGTWWKRKLVSAYVLSDPNKHLVAENLQFADLLGIARQYRPVLPQQRARPGALDLLPFNVRNTAYVVVHMKPGAVLRQWPDENWRFLIDGLRQRGLAVVATGSRDAAEIAYVTGILSGTAAAPDAAPACNLAGKLGFGEVSELISHSALFVGTDTSTTHVAAATGVATLALFGPTSVVRWGPWPRELQHAASPWTADAPSQSLGNVTILRSRCSCNTVRQTCLLRPGRPGVCMSQLFPHTVLARANELLGPAAAVASSA